MKKIPFILIIVLGFLTIPIFSKSQTPPVNNDQLISCFDNYTFGSINLDNIASERPSYSAGEVIKFKGLVENNNDYPIVNGVIFARVLYLDSFSDSTKNSDTVIDEFFVQDNINILPNGAYPLEFEYKLPENAPSGRYQLATYFLIAKKFNLSGVSFLSNVYGGLTQFEVKSDFSLNYFIDRNSFKLNNQQYTFRDFNPVFAPGTDIHISFKIQNITNLEANGHLVYKLYKWDSMLEQENFISQENEPITIKPKSSLIINKTFRRLSPNVYLVKIISNINNQRTIADVRFVIEGQKARINFSALNRFPLNKNELIKYFTCFHISSSYEAILNGSVITNIFDKDNKLLTQHIYQGQIYPEILSFEKTFHSQAKYDFLKINSQLLDGSGLILDDISIYYNCSHGANIPNKLSFSQKDNQISVFGLNWCGYPINVNLDEVIIKDLETDEIVFMKNHFPSSLFNTADFISLKPGLYEGSFRSGQFLLSEIFQILPPPPQLPVLINNSQNNISRYIGIIFIIIAILLIFYSLKNKKRSNKLHNIQKILLTIILVLLFIPIASNNVFAATTPAKLKCYSPNSIVLTNQTATFNAVGRDKNYSWSAPEGNPSSGVGKTFKTSFNSPGPKEVSVKTESEQATCFIKVGSSQKDLTCTFGKDGVCRALALGAKIQNEFLAKLNSALAHKGGSAGSAGGLYFGVVIKNPSNLIQNQKVIRSGDIISVNKPIIIPFDSEIYPQQISRTSEPGGPSGQPSESRPTGKTEPPGPTGTPEPAGPSEPFETIMPTGEWLFSIGVGDTPPITFSSKCTDENFIPEMYFIGGGTAVGFPGGVKFYTLRTAPMSPDAKYVNKKFAFGICAKIAQVKVLGLDCQGNQCFVKNTNNLTSKIFLEETYHIKAVAIKDPFGQKEIISSPIYEIFATKELDVSLNSPPNAEITLSDGVKPKLNQHIKLSSISKDPDNRPNKSLEQKWLILNKPPGSQAQISKQDSSSAYFIPDKPGKYEVALLVNDGLDIAKKVITLDIASSDTSSPALISSKSELNLKCNGSSDSCYVKMSPNTQKAMSLIPQSQDNTNIVNFKLFNIPKGINASLSSNSTNINQPVTLTIKTSYLPSGTYSFVIQASQGAKVKEQFVYVNIVEPGYKIPPEVEILPPLPPGF